MKINLNFSCYVIFNGGKAVGVSNTNTQCPMLGPCLLINLIQYISAPNNDTSMLALKWQNGGAVEELTDAQEICFDNSKLQPAAAAAAIVMITSDDDEAILTSDPDLI